MFMKPLGTKFEYEAERNRDLMRVYHECIASTDYISMPAIYEQVVNKPAERFWVSEERAAIVIASMMKGNTLEGMRPNKREMFEEIYRRAMILKEANPSMTIFDLAFATVRQPAPKFYLTPGSAKVIICTVKKQWYEERKRKLRHLF